MPVNSVNFAAITFVYQQTREPFKTKCVYMNDEHPKKGWKHVATINPAAWIELLMNNPADRQLQIEQLSI